MTEEGEGRFSLALQVCMTPRDEVSVIASDNEGENCDEEDHDDHQVCNEERKLTYGNSAEEEKEVVVEEDEDNVSDALMTFEIEVASNNNRVDTGRVLSEVGNLDSRRSMSEILNEGDLTNVARNDNLAIHSKIQ